MRRNRAIATCGKNLSHLDERSRCVLCVPLFGLVLTDDFGPLFVMLYAASIFLGAAFAFAFFDRAGYRQWLGGAVGVVVAGAWVYLVTFALYSLPAPLAFLRRAARVRPHERWRPQRLQPLLVDGLANLPWR